MHNPDAASQARQTLDVVVVGEALTGQDTAERLLELGAGVGDPAGH